MGARTTAAAAGVGAALAVLALAFVGDLHFRHGVEVFWRAEVDDRLIPVARTTEHRVTFPNPHRALARYVQAWNFETWGVPDHMPALDARIRATLVVPEGPPLLVEARSPNGTDVVVNNHRVVEPIPPGEHDLTVFWHGPLQPPATTHWTRILPASLELVWGPDAESLEPIPQSAFELPPGAANPERTALWAIAAALALLLGAGVYAVLRAPSAPRARRRAAVLGAILLVAFGLGLRLHDYEVMPEFRENMDELFATWNGWQLLEDGTTAGWTLWPARYVGWAQLERVEYFRKRPITVVSPYFEHPPLLHVMVGAAAHLGGAQEYLHARLSHTRLVPIGLGALTILLVVLVARRIDPRGPAPWLAGLLYAALPNIALMNRVIKEEALLTPLGLATILFFLRWRDEGEQRRDLLLAALFAGLAPLAKVPGLAFVPVLILLVARRGRWGAAAIAGAVSVAIASLLLVYAAAIDWELFWYVTRDQATIRGSAWEQFVPFFFDTLVNHNRVGRGFLIFLWLGFVGAVFAARRQGIAALTVPTVAYLVAMGLASGSWHYGWYMLPILPFLCIGAGMFLTDLWDEPELLRGAIFVLVPLAYAMTYAFDPQWVRSGWSHDLMRRWVGAFVILFLVPYGLAQLRRSPVTVLVARVATAAGVLLLVALSAFFVVRYEVLFETHTNHDDTALCATCEERDAARNAPAAGDARVEPE